MGHYSNRKLLIGDILIFLHKIPIGISVSFLLEIAEYFLGGRSNFFW